MVVVICLVYFATCMTQVWDREDISDAYFLLHSCTAQMKLDISYSTSSTFRCSHGPPHPPLPAAKCLHDTETKKLLPTKVSKIAVTRVLSAICTIHSTFLHSTFSFAKREVDLLFENTTSSILPILENCTLFQKILLHYTPLNPSRYASFSYSTQGRNPGTSVRAVSPPHHTRGIVQPFAGGITSCQ